MYGLYQIVKNNKGTLTITSGRSSLMMKGEGEIQKFDHIPYIDNTHRCTTVDGVKLTVICNFADHEVECPLLSNDAEILISNYEDRAQSVLRPFEAVVYETVL